VIASDAVTKIAPGRQQVTYRTPATGEVPQASAIVVYVGTLNG